MMRGKTALITGATAGIGFYTAAAIARRGARVFVTGRDEERGRRALAELRRLAGHDAIHFLIADASSVAGNVALAEYLCGKLDRLDLLINNAGGAFPSRGETDEEFERTLALNFIGPVLLTQQLLRLLGRSGSARIINVVSDSFRRWKGNPLDDPQTRKRFAGMEAYAHAKLLNVLFTQALARDLAGEGISVTAVSPGRGWTDWPLSRWLQRRAPAVSAGEAVAAAAASERPVPAGRYVDGKRQRRLPAHLLDSGLQDRAWDLGEALAARALPEVTRSSLLA